MDRYGRRLKLVEFRPDNDGSRVNTLPHLGKMTMQNVHSEDDAIIMAFSKGGGTPNGTYAGSAVATVPNRTDSRRTIAQVLFRG